MKYQDMILECFDGIIKEYGLKFIDVSENSSILLAENYAFLFTVHGYDDYFQYIYQNSENNFCIFDIRSYCASQFDQQDRQGIPAQETLADTFQATFMVLASGMKRHFSHILEGDKRWIEDYPNYELADDILPLDQKLEKIIRSNI
ncbi:hypothetical protein V6615_01745 [Oscillospiraceae bacterium PP1C4]